MSTGVSKIAVQRNQRVLLELLSNPGNDICADCKARAPRWASYNLGIFICVNCASIHRKIGTHITKVKSLTLDEWSKEQVEVMKENGNIKSNSIYNPNEARHPPPTNMIDSERDSELEKFIRSKYEFKRFMDRKSGTESRTSSMRARPAPLSFLAERETPPGPPLPPKTPEYLPAGLRHSATIPSYPHTTPLPTRSVSQPLPPLTHTEKLSVVPPLKLPAALSTDQKVAGKPLEDLISLQDPAQSSSLPLQYGSTPGAAPNPNPFVHLSLVTSPVSLPAPHSASVPTPTLVVGAQTPYSAPLSSPAFHLGATNPFNQAFSAGVGTHTTGAFPTGINPFSGASASALGSMPVSMAISTPTVTTTTHGVAGLTGPSQLPPTLTPTLAPFAPVPPPAVSTLPTPTGVSAGGSMQNPFTPMVTPGHTLQAPLSHPHPHYFHSGVTTNPISASAVQMQMPTGQTSLGQGHPQSQLQPHQPMGTTGFGTWAIPGQGVQGAF